MQSRKVKQGLRNRAEIHVHIATLEDEGSNTICQAGVVGKFEAEAHYILLRRAKVAIERLQCERVYCSVDSTAFGEFVWAEMPEYDFEDVQGNFRAFVLHCKEGYKSYLW